MPEIDPEVLSVFGFWGSILVLKLLVMVPLTGRKRFQKNAFANPEDAGFSDKGKVVYNDPDVERIRRAHLNDIENVLPWFIVTYLWLGTGPTPWIAKTMIQTFVLSRIAFTISYAIFPLQPLRSITFFIAFIVTSYEALKTIIYYF